MVLHHERKYIAFTFAEAVRAEIESDSNDGEEGHDDSRPDVADVFPACEPYVAAPSECLHS